MEAGAVVFGGNAFGHVAASALAQLRPKTSAAKPTRIGQCPGLGFIRRLSSGDSGVVPVDGLRQVENPLLQPAR